MSPHLSLSQLSFLVGVALGVGVVIILVAYFFHRIVRQGPGKEGSIESAVRVDDPTAFVLAAMQGVIASLKEEQNKTSESLRAAQHRADDALRKLEVISQEMEQGLLVFDRQGFICMANSPVRMILRIDTWSRRRYPEILGANSELAAMVGACLESGKATKSAMLEHQNASGGVYPICVSVIPLQTPNGTIEGGVCLVQERPLPSSQS